MGFGQAIAVTPIELVNTICAIINGGIYRIPHFLECITDSTGTLVYKNVTDKGERIVSEKTSETVRRLLLGVVDNGSGRLAGVSGYKIGGKTGTAQKYKEGSIDRGKYISSFIGYSTYDNPKYVIYFYVDEPEGYLYYGSQVAAPMVGEIFKNIFIYENEKPSETDVEFVPFKMPDFTGLSYEQAKKKCYDMGIYLEVEGEGKVASQFPYPMTECNSKTVVFLKLE